MSAGTIRSALDTADHCHATVTRRGLQDACGKPPVALIAETGEFAKLDGSPTFWPACARHANRCAGSERYVLSLMQIMAAVRHGGES